MIYRWCLVLHIEELFWQKQMIFEFRDPRTSPRLTRELSDCRNLCGSTRTGFFFLPIGSMYGIFYLHLIEFYGTYTIHGAFKKSFFLQTVQCLSHPGKLTFCNLKSAKLKRKIMKPTLLCSMLIFRGVRIWVAIYLAWRGVTRSGNRNGCCPPTRLSVIYIIHMNWAVISLILLQVAYFLDRGETLMQSIELYESKV